MFCSSCGKTIDPAARFCCNCGAAFQPAAGYPYARRPLMRSRSNRMVGGVCAAFAFEYGWELSMTRIVTALLIVFTGVGLIAYIAAWIIIPEEPLAPFVYPDTGVPTAQVPGQPGVSA
jgi:phage shock protein C